MKRIACGLCFAGAMLATASFSAAQPPGGGKKGDKSDKGAKGGPATPDVVTVMMGFDKDGDGKVTRAEVTDARLVRLFEQADAGKTGVVSREQFAALQTKLDADDAAGGKGGKGDKGGPPPGGKGGPGGDKGFKGGPDGKGGPPKKI